MKRWTGLKQKIIITRLLIITLSSIMLLFLVACSTYNESFKHGQDFSKDNRWEEAILYFQKAVSEKPDNQEYKDALSRAKQEAAKARLAKAKEAFAASAQNLSAMEKMANDVDVMLSMDPSNAEIKAFQSLLNEKINSLKANLKNSHQQAKIGSLNSNNIGNNTSPSLTTIPDAKPIKKESIPDKAKTKPQETAKTNKPIKKHEFKPQRAIVITAEKNLGKSITTYILKEQLKEQIRKKGYEIVIYDQKGKHILNAPQYSKEAIRQLGRQYSADIVIIGNIESSFSEKMMEIYSAKANGNVVIYKISENIELNSSAKSDVKGFGSDEEKAGIDSLKKISIQLADESTKIFQQKTRKKK